MKIAIIHVANEDGEHCIRSLCTLRLIFKLIHYENTGCVNA